MTNLDKFKTDLAKLIKHGEELDLALIADRVGEDKLAKMKKEDAEVYKKFRGRFSAEYQSWYTTASALIRQLLPERQPEFVGYYMADPKRKKVDIGTYKIQDWMNGVTSAFNAYEGRKYFEDSAIVLTSYRTQLQILRACETRFTSSLHDIRAVLQADLFASELDAARELHKKGFLRAAGAMCGVVLEAHLQQVAANHNVTIKKAHPTISDLNDPLRNAGVYDVPPWRQIQHLADIRNLCDHKKGREPTAEEITDLIDGTSKITKTIC